ncbi:MAG TPA: Hpt domain-containing protein [Fimbriimonas sp.]|nr:Hpt domain-containing protein [Fimbriimonas sp.]
MDLVSSQIDREYLSEISGGDTEFEQELVQTFLDAAPDLIAAYKAACAKNDALGASHAAHTLKGSSRSIGASAFATVSEQAEIAAREGDVPKCILLSGDIDAAFKVLASAGSEFLKAA